MAIDINKIVENALVESDKKETLTENEEIKDLETEITFTEEDEETINMFNELFSIAESTAFASGLGALTFRSQLKSISEANGVRRPMSLKKKIGIGIGSGLAAAGAGYAAYKNKDQLGSLAKKTVGAIKSRFGEKSPTTAIKKAAKTVNDGGMTDARNLKKALQNRAAKTVNDGGITAARNLKKALQNRATKINDGGITAARNLKKALQNRASKTVTVI